MIKVISIRKTKNGYEMVYEHNQKTASLPLFEDVLLRHILRPNTHIDSKKLEAIKSDQVFETHRHAAIKKLAKPLTTQELRLFLIKEGADEKTCNTILSEMQERNYLNDEAIAKRFIEIKKHEKGPLWIKAKLRERGAADAIINEVLNQIDYTVKREAVLNILKNEQKRLKPMPKIKAKQTLARKLIARGFEDSLVFSLLNTFEFEQVDDLALCQRDFEKVKLKLTKKHEGKALQAQLLRTLMAKGYSIQTIKRCIEE